MSQPDGAEPSNAETRNGDAKECGVRLRDDLTPAERERLYAAVGLMLDYILDNAPSPSEEEKDNDENSQAAQEPEPVEGVTSMSSNHKLDENSEQAEPDTEPQVISVDSVTSDEHAYDPEAEPVQLSLDI